MGREFRSIDIPDCTWFGIIKTKGFDKRAFGAIRIGLFRFEGLKSLGFIQDGLMRFS